MLLSFTQTVTLLDDGELNQFPLVQVTTTCATLQHPPLLSCSRSFFRSFFRSLFRSLFLALFLALPPRAFATAPKGLPFAHPRAVDTCPLPCRPARSYVLITVKSVYSKVNNGAKQITFHRPTAAATRGGADAAATTVAANASDASAAAAAQPQAGAGAGAGAGDPASTAAPYLREGECVTHDDCCHSYAFCSRGESTQREGGVFVRQNTQCFPDPFNTRLDEARLVASPPSSPVGRSRGCVRVGASRQSKLAWPSFTRTDGAATFQPTGRGASSSVGFKVCVETGDVVGKTKRQGCDAEASVTGAPKVVSRATHALLSCLC